ncbi:glutamate 5-kinase [Geotalea uraniireducens Rf4]|uniref:Glutamate 5-kinase n=2 Tax=Geotalea uraniireducens TaxID=351604 RepID=A5G907_GEOUR|nr:glutamate 5-kinase [Geotalea uraniireducens Rf4]
MLLCGVFISIFVRYNSTMRKEILKKVKRIVIKIGSRVLTCDDNGLDSALIGGLAGEVSHFRKKGYEIVIVSSGAVAAGRKELGLGDRPRTIPQKQAAAAIGQSKLMRAYEEAFAGHEIKVAQLLLTRDDLANRLRFLNARATIDTLLDCGIIPIINENDTVVVDEIKFGDNDNLSALVTNLVEAQLLVILTDIDGFYSADPRTDPDARLIHLVSAITREVERAAGGSASTVGTGGMATKVAAAKKVGKSGVSTLMINGKTPGNLERALTGDEVGTLFLPADTSLNRRKHWIAYTLRPVGRIIVDNGAREVLARHGRSLLPSGVVRVEGKFDRGACVRVCGPDGTEFARGIADYSSREIELIHGRKSGEIEQILGYRYGDDIIHRDNLVVL